MGQGRGVILSTLPLASWLELTSSFPVTPLALSLPVQLPLGPLSLLCSTLA